MERRWGRDGDAPPKRCEGRLRRLGRPGRGRSDSPTAPSRSPTTGASPPSGRAAELGEGERFEGCVIVPGLRQLPHAPRVRGLRRVRRRAAVRAVDRPPHRSARARSTSTTCARSRGSAPGSASAPGVTTIGDCSFAGAAAEAAAETGLAAIVFLEVFGQDASALERFDGEPRARRAGRSPTACRLGVSPHAPYTCTLDVYEACAALGLPMQTHLAESPAERPLARRRDGRLVAARRVPRAAARRRPASGCSRTPACSARSLLGRPLRPRRRRGDRAARRARRRRRPLPSLERHPRLRHRAARRAARRRDRRSGSPPTAPPRRRRFDLFEELRTAIVAARARAQSPEALSARRARSSSRRSAARACSGSSDEVGSLVPGKWADLAVVSLEGSPLDPVEDPAAAVVLGGSPDRVAATLVAGDDRYRRGTSAWPDTRRAARKARSRMLR